MNQRLAFEQAVKQLKLLKRYAEDGDVECQRQSKAYEECNVAILSTPFPTSIIEQVNRREAQE